MLEANDLLPPEILKWLLDQLQVFRHSGSNGTLQLNIQDGYILTYEDTRKHKNTRRERHRTKNT